MSHEYGNRTAIRYYNRYRFQSWSYSELLALTHQCANWLYSKNLTKGDKVIIYARNCPQWTVLMFACALSGIVIVPIDRASPLSFVSKIAGLTEPKMIFTDHELSHANLEAKIVSLEDLFELINTYETNRGKNYTLVKGDDIFEIMYTSGTTGSPKGAVITHRNIVTNIIAVKQRLTYHIGWKFLSVLPLSHILEQNLGCISVLRCGGTITYVNNSPFSKYLDVMIDDKITHIVTVPALLQNLQVKIYEVARNNNSDNFLKTQLKICRRLPLSLKRAFTYPIRKRIGSSLQAFICGGAPISASTEQFWEDLGIAVSQGYGLTEASPIVSCNSLENRTLGSVGWPVAHQYVRLADNGEILLGGENVIREYYKEPALTAQYFENGWYKTGDIGRFDSNGKLYILGRVKEMILTANGMNVFPTDIESAINHIVQSKESVVFEDPERQGALIGAVIGNYSPEELKKYRHQINSELAAHQQVSKLINWMNDNFPKTVTLKVRRKEVDRNYKEWLESQKSGKTITQKSIVMDPVLLIVAELVKKEPSPELFKNYIKKDLGLDSLEQTTLVLMLEERFNVDVDDTLFDSDITVEQLSSWIEKHKGTKKSFKPSLWPWHPLAKGMRTGIFSLFELFWFRRKFTIKNDAPLDQRLIMPGKPIIFIANHSSHIDAPLILSTLPPSLKYRTAIAAASDYFFENKSSVGLFFKRLLLPVFPFQRTAQQKQNLEIISRIMSCNNHILLFPEGTRSRNGEMQPFKSGIGLLVKEFDAQVIPIYIGGAFDLWPASQKKPKSGTVLIRYGKPMSFGKRENPGEIASQLENAVRQLGVMND